MVNNSFRKHQHTSKDTHTHTIHQTTPDTAHKCLYARPSLFRSLQTYICGPCSGLCSLSRRLVTIRSLWCLSSRRQERPRTTGVGGRGRSPLIRAPAPGPRPVALPEAFGGNRRLYTAAAPAADHLVSIPVHARFTPGPRLYL